MKIFPAFSATVLLSLPWMGCAAFHKGQDVVKYEKYQTPRVTQTSTAGNYALYSSTDVSPKVTVFVEKGQPIGFETDTKSGQTVAIAGKERYAVATDQNHYWARL
jgi:hypothetical protein